MNVMERADVQRKCITISRSRKLIFIEESPKNILLTKKKINTKKNFEIVQNMTKTKDKTKIFSRAV